MPSGSPSSPSSDRSSCWKPSYSRSSRFGDRSPACGSPACSMSTRGPSAGTFAGQICALTLVEHGAGSVVQSIAERWKALAGQRVQRPKRDDTVAGGRGRATSPRNRIRCRGILIIDSQAYSKVKKSYTTATGWSRSETEATWKPRQNQLEARLPSSVGRDTEGSALRGSMRACREGGDQQAAQKGQSTRTHL